jgi:hypothetical protein
LTESWLTREACPLSVVAPGMGFEPMRPKGATGSQGLRIIHSALGM